MGGRISKEVLGFLGELSRRIERIKEILRSFFEKYSLFLQSYLNLQRRMIYFLKNVERTVVQLEVTIDAAREVVINEDYLQVLPDIISDIMERKEKIEALKKELRKDFRMVLKLFKSLKDSINRLKTVKKMLEGLERRIKILRKREIGLEILSDVERLKGTVSFLLGRYIKNISSYLDNFEKKIVILYKKYLGMKIPEIKYIYKYARNKRINKLREIDDEVHRADIELLRNEKELLNLSKEIARNTKNLIERRPPKKSFLFEEFEMMYKKILSEIDESTKKINLLIESEELFRSFFEKRKETFLYFNERFKEYVKRGKGNLTNYLNAMISFLKVLFNLMEEVDEESLGNAMKMMEGLLNFRIEDISEEILKSLKEYKKRITDIVTTIEMETLYEIQRDLEFFGEIIRIFKRRKEEKIELDGFLFVLENKLSLKLDKKREVDILGYYKSVSRDLKNCIRELKKNASILKKEIGREVRETIEYIIRKIEEVLRDIRKIEEELRILYRYTKKRTEIGRISEERLRNKIKLFISKIRNIVDRADRRSFEISDIKFFIKDISQIFEDCKKKVYRKIDFKGICTRYHNIFLRSLENSLEELKGSLKEIYELLYFVNLSASMLRPHLESE